MTNLEMLLAKPGKETIYREQFITLRGLLAYYVEVKLLNMDELQKAWKLNEVTTTVLNAPSHLFPTC